MNTPENSDNAPPKQSNPLKGLWLKLLLGIAVLLILITAGATYLIFAPWQEIPAAVVNINDFTVQYRLLQRVSKELSNSRKELNQKGTLELSPEEINSLFRLSANRKPSRSPYPLRYYRAAFSDKGEFSAVIPIDTTLKWLWGGTIYLKVRFTLSKSEGKDLQCNIVSCKVTSLPVSRATAQKIVDRMMAEKQVQEHLNKVNTVIRSLSFEKGKLRIEYLPQQILLLMVR